MKNQNNLFAMFLSLLVLVGGLQNNCYSQSEKPQKPNVLFIAVDDMNDWVGPLEGKEEIKTPNLDDLAASGQVFTNAHTASPACAPSRTALLTGVHPVRSDIMQNTWFDGPEWREQEALKDVETLSQFFKNRGYKTLGGGKIWHTLTPPWQILSQIEPENWDYYYPSKHINIPYQVRAPEEVIRPDHFEGKRHPWFTWGPIPVEDNKMSDYQVVDWASYELGQEHENPFFMATGIFRPHMPWEVPQKYFDMYPLDEISLPETKKNDLIDALDHGRRSWHKFVLQNDQWKKVVQAYMASISFADAQIGRLLDALENSPHADNTIIVLWSDHGMHIGEKENWEKFTLWEESTRVPLIIRVPGMTEPGSTSNQPVSLLDIYPTLAEVTGFESSAHLDGTSLVPQIQNPQADHKPVISSFRFSFDMDGDRLVGHSVRSKHYRYIYYPALSLEELYNHQTDPNEYNNIAYKESSKDIVHRHRQRLLELIPNLQWSESVPKGYQVKDGQIKNANLKPISEIVVD